MSGSASETKAQSLRGCKSLHVSNPGVCFRRIRSACAAGDSRCVCLTQVLRIQGAGLLEHYPAAPAWAQTASTALVLGTVTDPGGAVVPDANVELTNTATNETKTVTTNSAGQYVFPNTAPGTYTLKISKAGFATTTFSNIKLDVSKSYTYDAKLEVSSGKETVEVSAGAVAELQTADAT